MELLEFMSEHVFLAFIIICCIYFTIKHVFYYLPKLIIRHLNIRKNGWPPAHLDADGDFKEDTRED